MYRRVTQVWLVHDPEQPRPALWETKTDAEMYARQLFPDESPDKRYARIQFMNVYSLQGESK